MKKYQILTALMALFTLAFVGCQSDGDNKDNILGPRPEDDSGIEDAYGMGVNDPNSGSPEGEHPKGKAVFGDFSAIHFDTDSAAIKSGDNATLNKVANYLNSNPDAKILVAGNCDDRGTAEYNRALGQRRAQAARSYLVKKGISANRISTVSYGEDKPIGTYPQNRRDDFGKIN